MAVTGTIPAYPPPAGGVAARLEAVRQRITAAGRPAADVRIVAVTKGFGPEAVEAALEAGLPDVGENYAQELLAKSAALAPSTARRCRWHFLGRVQRAKVRALGPVVHLWQGVDREAAGREIAHRAPASAVLVQVNVSGQPGRNGCGFEEAPALVDRLREMGLDVRGLMAVGPPGPPEGARPGFRRLSALADRLGLDERSMGMTDDLEVAVQEGATMVRVGRALFGARAVPAELRQ